MLTFVVKSVSQEHHRLFALIPKIKIVIPRLEMVIMISFFFHKFGNHNFVLAYLMDMTQHLPI